MKAVKLCKCRGENIKLYLVFAFDYDQHLLTLRAVDRSQKRADEHLEMVRQESRSLVTRTRAWVEENLSDHAFAADMYKFKGKPGSGE